MIEFGHCDCNCRLRLHDDDGTLLVEAFEPANDATVFFDTVDRVEVTRLRDALTRWLETGSVEEGR